MIEPSEDQWLAIDAIQFWKSEAFREDNQYMTMGGFAGTGKSTVINYLTPEWHGVRVAAFFGKAAHNLRAKGTDAQTIHSLIYCPYEWEGKTRWRKVPRIDARIIVIDEASTIDHILMTDLLSFGIPVLFIGDHGQLEPIGRNPNLMKDPKIKLEKIHRQASNNPILRLAMAFREGREVPKWQDKAGRLKILDRRRFWDYVSPNIQMVCGFNKTRHTINEKVRRILKRTHLVEPGDKLICLRNNGRFAIFNGQQMFALEVVGETRESISIQVRTDDHREFVLPCLKEQFAKNTIEDFDTTTHALVDYGWCLTAHKSIGSEWDDVLVLEEVGAQWNPARWKYTSATRAKERLVWCG